MLYFYRIDVSKGSDVNQKLPQKSLIFLNIGIS